MTDSCRGPSSEDSLENGAALLADASEFNRRYVVLSLAQADVCATWTLHTHVIDAADHTPYLNISSPVRRSGKTKLLRLLKLQVAKPWFTGRVTASVLVRKTAKDHPTLLLDESDMAFHSNREYAETLRGVLNTGFERDGTYSMCVQSGQDWTPKDFATFSAKAIAGIGRLPDTVEDRSLPIRLKRKLRDEACDGFRMHAVRPIADRLRERMAKWAKENAEALCGAMPIVPVELNDRQQDVCEPLVAIADRVGSVWPSRIRSALIDLCHEGRSEDGAHSVMLLGDIRSVFEKRQTDRIPSVELVYDLISIETSIWSEYDRGRSLTASGLARQLGPFDVRPRDIRFECGILKGYMRADFEDAWARYLPS
jgi:hypothetical protein